MAYPPLNFNMNYLNYHFFIHATIKRGNMERFQSPRL